MSPKRDFKLEAAAFGLAEGLRKLAVDSELGIPTRLTAVGIAEKDAELLASESMKQTRLLPNNPREVTPLADARGGGCTTCRRCSQLESERGPDSLAALGARGKHFSRQKDHSKSSPPKYFQRADFFPDAM